MILKLSFYPQIEAQLYLLYLKSSCIFCLLLLLLSCFSCVPTLSDPRDGSPPGSPVPGILQARTLEWVAIAFSNAWKWKVKVKSLSRVRLCATPWTAAYQAPLSTGFSRKEYWSGMPLPSAIFFFWSKVYLLSTQYMTGTLLNLRNTVIVKTEKSVFR